MRIVPLRAHVEGIRVLQLINEALVRAEPDRDRVLVRDLGPGVPVHFRAGDEPHWVGRFRLKLPWLLSGSGVVTGTSGDEARDEGAEESFAPAARVVHELEEAEVVRQLLLRDAPMRAEPRAQQ